MKRRSQTPRRATQSRDMLHRVGPVVMGVAMAGAVSFPAPSSELAFEPRTGGAVIEAWAFGTLSDATRPNSQAACDLSHLCELVISSAGGTGTGTGATIKTFFESSAQGELSANLPFTLTETIDYPHPVTKGAPGKPSDGACYPVTGVMEISDGSSKLVLDIVGQACQVGRSTTQLVFTGSYVSDAVSDGDFANADGIGTVNINNPSGLAGTGQNMKASLVGQLKYGD